MTIASRDNREEISVCLLRMRFFERGVEEEKIVSMEVKIIILYHWCLPSVSS